MSGSESPLLRYQSELDRIDAVCKELIELNSIEELTTEQMLWRDVLVARLHFYNHALGVSYSWKPVRMRGSLKADIFEYVEVAVFVFAIMLGIATLLWVLVESFKLLFMLAPSINFVP